VKYANLEKAPGHGFFEVLDSLPEYRCECGERVSSRACLVAHVLRVKGALKRVNP
jgi:hypothetical protein